MRRNGSVEVFERIGKRVTALEDENARLKELLRDCGELLDKAGNIIDRHSYDDFAKVQFKAAADRIKKEFGVHAPHGKDER